MINEQEVLEAMDNLMIACGASAMQPLFKGLPEEFVGEVNNIITTIIPKHLQAMQSEVQQCINEKMRSIK